MQLEDLGADWKLSVFRSYSPERRNRLVLSSRFDFRSGFFYTLLDEPDGGSFPDCSCRRPRSACSAINPIPISLKRPSILRRGSFKIIDFAPRLHALRPRLSPRSDLSNHRTLSKELRASRCNVSRVWAGQNKRPRVCRDRIMYASRGSQANCGLTPTFPLSYMNGQPFLAHWPPLSLCLPGVRPWRSRLLLSVKHFFDRNSPLLGALGQAMRTYLHFFQARGDSLRPNLKNSIVSKIQGSHHCRL